MKCILYLSRVYMSNECVQIGFCLADLGLLPVSLAMIMKLLSHLER